MAQPLETSNGRNTNGRFPLDSAATRSHPQSEVYSDNNIPDPFMPDEITPAKEIEWAWWTEATEIAFPEGEPQDWGSPDLAREPKYKAEVPAYASAVDEQISRRLTGEPDLEMPARDSLVEFTPSWGVEPGLTEGLDRELERRSIEIRVSQRRSDLENARKAKEAKAQAGTVIETVEKGTSVPAPKARRRFFIPEGRRIGEGTSEVSYHLLESGAQADLLEYGDPMSKGQGQGVWSFGPDISREIGENAHIVFDADSIEPSDLVDRVLGLPPAELPPIDASSLDEARDREAPHSRYGKGLPTYGAFTRWDQSQ